MLRDKDQTPPWPIIGLGDHLTAMTLFAGICAALFRREQTDKGCEVTTSLIATGAWANGVPLQNALCGNDVSATRDKFGWINPFGSVYTTSDGHHILLIMSNPTAEWPRLLKAISRESWSEDDRFSTRERQIEHGAVLKSMISDVIGMMCLEDLAPRLEETGIAWSEIQNLKQASEDPQFHVNDIFVPYETNDQRVEAVITNPLRFNGAVADKIDPPPELGAHTREVLSDFGFSNGEIEALQAEGTIGSN